MTVCFVKVNIPEISATLVREAETVYSRGRLRNLAEEWVTMHPSLSKVFSLITRWKNGSQFNSIPAKLVHDLAVDLAGQSFNKADDLVVAAENLVERGGEKHEKFARAVLCVLYKVGAIGVKTQTSRPTIWSESDEASLREAEILDDSKIYVHKALHSALGVILD